MSKFTCSDQGIWLTQTSRSVAIVFAEAVRTLCQVQPFYSAQKVI